MQPWFTAFKQRDDLQPYGDNALGLFALAMKFGLDDLATVAADSLTDANDDKKCDIIYVDRTEGVSVIAQCYFSQKTKKEAPSSKASDLNTAVTWLLQTPLKDLPEKLRSPALQLREGIREGEIKDLHIWYIHNLPESINVGRELEAVERTAQSAIRSEYPNQAIRISGREVGQQTFEMWYADTQSQILVNETFNIDVVSGFEITGPKWKAYVTSLPATFLYDTYKKYETRLFSANVREYLGSRKSDSNINFGIKNTAEHDHEDFWVFNNGLTILVNKYSFEEKGVKKRLNVSGMSIVNGAQTTGAIGTLDRPPNVGMLVPVRFVETNSSELVRSIVQFNNSQNKITASDFRSADIVQRRLKEEFAKIPKSEYDGGRRGSSGDAIRRRPNLLPSYTVGQALAALHGDPIVAYNQKSEIWSNDRLYSKYFNEETTAAHIIFAYGLLRAVENKKMQLVDKDKEGAGLTDAEKIQLSFFRKRGSIYLLVSAISSCIETFSGKHVPNRFRLSFKERTSPVDSQEIWAEIVEVAVSFCSKLEDAISDGLKNADKVSKAIQTYGELMQATAIPNADVYKKFAVHIR
jgi:AIPR protein